MGRGVSKSGVDRRRSSGKSGALSLNRRQVLWGGGALLASNLLAAPARPVEPSDLSTFYKLLKLLEGFLTDLSFNWDAASGLLTVQESISDEQEQKAAFEKIIAVKQAVIDRKTSTEAERNSARVIQKNAWNILRLDPPRWLVDLRQFDLSPNLKLRILSTSVNARGYEIAVSCNGRQKFTKSIGGNTSAARQLVLRFNRGNDRSWTVTLQSDYWSKRGDFGALKFSPAAFKTLAEGTASKEADAKQAGDAKEHAPFEGIVAPGALAASLSELFGTQILAKSPVQISVLPNLTWSAAAAKKNDHSMLVFGGQVVCDTLHSFVWTKNDNEDGKLTAALTKLTAQGLGSTTDEGLVMGDQTAFHVHFKLEQDKDARSLSFQVACASDLLGPMTTLSKQRWTFKVQNHNDNMAGRAPSSGEHDDRNNIVGQASGSGEMVYSTTLGQDGKAKIELTAKLADIRKTVAPRNTAENNAGPASEDFYFDTYLGKFKAQRAKPIGEMNPEAAKPPPTSEKEQAKPDMTAAAQPAPPADAGKAAPVPSSDTSKKDGKDQNGAKKVRPAELWVKATENDGKPVLHWFDLRLGLLQAPYALADASNSRLSFASSVLAVLYSDQPVSSLPSSYLWLDPKTPPRQGLARFDLTRAELAAQNDVELLALKFRFADLALLVPAAALIDVDKQALQIVPLPEECRLLPTMKQDEAADVRPRLVVEFPPQHVMEQTAFIPKLEQPPSILDPEVTRFGTVDGKEIADLDPRLLLLEMARLGLDEKGRAARREEWRTNFIALNNGNIKDGWTKFAAFQKAFEDSKSIPDGLPSDQRIYIGPEGLEPDGSIYARKISAQRQDARLDKLIEQMSDGVVKYAIQLLTNQRELKEKDLWPRLEQLLEAEYSLYGLFREFFQEKGIKAKSAGKAPGFFILANDSNTPVLDVDHALGEVGASRKDFLNRLSGAETLDKLMRARLSGPSRLVFAVNCLPYEADAEEKPGIAAAIDFTLAGLTNWSKHELVVVRRAQNLYQPDEHGLLGPMNRRIANLNDKDILTFQGITAGPFTSAQERLAAVTVSLRDPPSGYETAIEFPSRLVLSPNQSAVWRTPHNFEKRGIFNISETPAHTPLGAEVDEKFVERRPRGGDQPLWRANLDFKEFEPGLRAVYSPDFRPGFFWSKFGLNVSDKDPKDDKFYKWLKIAGNQPPPRGPFAPWYLGREVGDAALIEAKEAFNSLPEVVGFNDDHQNDKAAAGADFAEAVAADPRSYEATLPSGKKQSFSLPWIISYLLGREKAAKAVGNDSFFRTSMDASDRHELVLLTSAHGLPVQGRRNSKNALMGDSDEYEPPEGFDLIDVAGDTAVYRARTLNSKGSELVLTSLGGSFRHDSGFQPPAAALGIYKSRLYTSPSLERWQMWAVIGRDIYVEIVYKGFLFPFGIKASLVKVTERTFFRSNDDANIRAYLRQRMFLRCSTPEKTYPALHQPNEARQFQGRLKLLTSTTPDIVDPTGGKPIVGDGLQLESNGRLWRANTPGLVFWPRTARSSEANVHFDLAFDGKNGRMPLIFAENTAVQDAGFMADLVKYYNGIRSPDKVNAGPDDFRPRDHLRSVALAGQAMRYCEEKKAGDSSIETDLWTLKAQGRAQDGDESLEGANDKFEMDAQMQGADQPPFYPAIETMRLRIKQIERLMARPGPSILAQYDGGYIKAGFKTSGDSAVDSPAAKNALDVFLNFASSVDVKTETNGDRTGGVYSPGNNFVAMSRLNGPVGGKRPESAGSEKKIDLELQHPAEIGVLQDWSREYIGYLEDAGQPGKPGELAPITASRKKTEVFKNHFSSKAKLLGVLRLDQLIEFLKAPLPVLQEVVEYGSAAMHELDAGAAQVEQILKQQVLMPLLRVVADIENIWREVVLKWNSLGAAAGDSAGYLDLTKLFPEIGDGLSGLRDSINIALSADGAIDFAYELSAVYQSGQQLYQGLSRLAANPVGRLSDGAQKLLDQYVAAITSAYADVITFLKGIDLDNLRRDLLDKLAESISAELKKLDGGNIDFASAIKAPFTSLVDRLEKATPELKNFKVKSESIADLKKAIEDLERTIEKPFDIVELQQIIRNLVGRATDENPAKGNSLDSYFTDANDLDTKLKTITASINAIIEQVEDAYLDNFFTKAEVQQFLEYLAALEDFVADFQLARNDLNAAGASATNSADRLRAVADCARIVRPYLPPSAGDQVWRLGLLAAQLASIVENLASKKGDHVAAIQSGLNLLSPLIGSHDVNDLTGALTDASMPFRGYIDDLKVALKPVDATLLGNIEKDSRDASASLAQLQRVFEKNFDAVKSSVLVDQAFKLSYQNFMETLPGLSRAWSNVAALAAAAKASDWNKSLDALPTTNNLLFDLINGKDEKLELAPLQDMVRLRRDCLTKAAEAVAATLATLHTFVAPNAGTLGAAAGLAAAYDNLSAQQKTDIATWLADHLEATADALRSGIVSATAFAHAVLAVPQPFRLIKYFKDIDQSLANLPSPLKEEFNSFGKLLADDESKLTKLMDKNAALEDALSIYGTKLKAFNFKPHPAIGDSAADLNDFMTLLTASTEFKNVKTAIADLEMAADTKPNDYATEIRNILTKLPIDAEARLFEYVARLKTAVKPGLAKVAIDIAQVIATGGNSKDQPGLVLIYASLEKTRNGVLDELDSLPAALTGKLREVVLIPKPGQQQEDTTRADDLLIQESDLLEKLRSGDPETLAQDLDFIASLRGFVRSWQGLEVAAAPVQMTRRASKIVEIVLRGQVFSLVDFSALRDEVERYIKQLVPLRATLSYKFAAPFGDSENVKHIKALTFGVFVPAEESNLTINTTVKVEFLKPLNPQMNVVGELGPFTIKLVGDYLDAVTIKFKGALFTVKNGGSPHVDLFYDDFKIGKDLEFVQKLQAYLTPEKGSGFFLRAMLQPLGLEAGYGLVLPILTLGTISFSNISLNASMIIPFDGSSARFRASLSRVDAPFTISAAPYGGSGYFGIEADASGIVGFDASFQYGGAAAFQFGPMKGMGRLMVGIYIRQTTVVITNSEANEDGNKPTKKLVEIMATFYVGGTASIWIFNFGASLYVRLGMSDGNMVGEATFTFSFSCGFVDFDYSITVQRKENKMGSGQSSWLGSVSPIEVASNDDSIGTDTKLESPPCFKNIKRVNDTVCQSQDWKTYQSYFADDASITNGGDWL